MLDPKLLRSELPAVAEQLARRGVCLDQNQYVAWEAERKTLQASLQDLQTQRNRLAKEIGVLKSQGQPTEAIMAEVETIGQHLKATHIRFDECQSVIKAYQLTLPNMPKASVPDGKEESDNREVRRWGEPTVFGFEPKDHVALGEASGNLDFQTAAKLSGSRFVVLHAPLARLHRALGQFMLDLHVEEHGYEETYVPYLVNDDSLFGTGQLPKFRQDQFVLASENPLTLIPTAEVPLANLYRGEILSAEQLPVKRVAQTPCFRSEAGSYGKDTKGMIRQHQFEKVELVQLTHPSQSDEALEALTGHAEAVLQRLELPYRVMHLCAGDMGFSASTTYDLEVWLPGQNRYREISSCSNCTDFQARRLQARFRTSDGKKPELLHTLNGSGVAVGRALIAVMENYQTKAGDIVIPGALRSYLKGASQLSALCN